MVKTQCDNCIYWESLDNKKEKHNTLGFIRNNIQHKNIHIKGYCKYLSRPLILNESMESEIFKENELPSVFLKKTINNYEKELGKTNVIPIFLSDAEVLLPVWVTVPSTSFLMITDNTFFCGLFKNKDKDE
jgi:hypothetical protein